MNSRITKKSRNATHPAWACEPLCLWQCARHPLGGCVCRAGLTRKSGSLAPYFAVSAGNHVTCVRSNDRVWLCCRKWLMTKNFVKIPQIFHFFALHFGASKIIQISSYRLTPQGVLTRAYSCRKKSLVPAYSFTHPMEAAMKLRNLILPLILVAPLLFGTTCYAEESPLEMVVRSRHPALGIPCLEVTCIVDSVTIQGLILNRGNVQLVPPDNRLFGHMVPKFPTTLKFGERKYFLWESESPGAIREVVAQTNQGRWTYTFE